MLQSTVRPGQLIHAPSMLANSVQSWGVAARAETRRCFRVHPHASPRSAVVSPGQSYGGGATRGSGLLPHAPAGRWAHYGRGVSVSTRRGLPPSTARACRSVCGEMPITIDPTWSCALACCLALAERAVGGDKDGARGRAWETRSRGAAHVTDRPTTTFYTRATIMTTPPARRAAER